MFLLDKTTVVTSATDLIQAATCEFAFMRKLDQKLGRDVVVPEVDDEMLKRAGVLGDQHEERQLESYIADLGESHVAIIPRPADLSAASLSSRETETVAALKSDAEIVFQATFFEPQQKPATSKNHPAIAFVGYADFIARTPNENGEPVWQVQDTKLARSPKPAALVQIAAYAQQLERLGFETHEDGVIILGDGSRSAHRLSEVFPLFLSRRERMHALIYKSWNLGSPIEWEDTTGDEATLQACRRCEVCEPEVLRTRDPLLIGGIRVQQRDRLYAAGYKTIDDVASIYESAQKGSTSIEGINQQVLKKVTAQAHVQLQSEDQADGKPAWVVLDPSALAAIPKPSPGDIFFDFEGDPLYHGVLPSGTEVWNIDYLFGLVDENEDFTAFWAHNLEEEKQALIDFVNYVQARRAKYPDLHIYHYAPYEKTHLKSLAARYGVCEEEIDDLLRNEVLVDLYYVVKSSLLVGSPSYSIKKLEPLYMGGDIRDQEGVTSGADSVAEYARAAELMRSDIDADRQEALSRLKDIEDYNRYDCVSTVRLRNWLLQIAVEQGIKPQGLSRPDSDGTRAGDEPREPKPEEEERSALAKKLMERADRAAHEGLIAERNVYAMAASAIDYHRREQKSFWWEHFDRLVAPLDEWADTKDVFVVEGSPEIVLDWGRPGKVRKDQRRIFLPGSFAPGSSVKENTKVYAIYEPNVEGPERNTNINKRVSWSAEIKEITSGGITLLERTNTDNDHWYGFPVALTPGAPPRAGTQVEAIAEWGEKLLRTEELPQDPVVDIIARNRPNLGGEIGSKEGLVRTESDIALEIGGEESLRTVGAVTASVLDLNDSALAVQGPPGTGKTFLAARLIKYLVERHSWRIGVVAQSHKVVENVLDGVVRAGLDKRLVAKELQTGASTDGHLFTIIKDKKFHDYIADRESNGEGFVVGGTAWLFSNETRLARRSLDLLVIDEAGQFSLAPTIASSVAAKRLLLLGDPQQLPQVSQGSHPEPVNESALGWLTEGHETLPADLGFFLAETWRMRSELTRVVSALSYENRLQSHPSTNARDVAGLGDPGLVWHPVAHTANTTSSKEEAEVVLKIARDALQSFYSDKHVSSQALTQKDIIVVAPYNAQVEVISDVLSEAGFEEIRVGTVDKFQGQEALIAIVSLAASSPAEVARGLDFLLMPNRLNVAISRAKWAAHLVSSSFLGGSGLPASLAEMRSLSGYLMLTGNS